MNAWAKDVLAGLGLIIFVTMMMCGLPLLAPDGASVLRHAIETMP